MPSVMWKFYLPITISARQFFDFLTLICDFQHWLFLLTLIISDIDSLNCGLYVFIEEKTLHTKYFLQNQQGMCVLYISENSNSCTYSFHTIRYTIRILSRKDKMSQISGDCHRLKLTENTIVPFHMKERLTSGHEL